jgi:NAD(P)-dependent dehydrogenase (short-subunit alcohol dehydrogenase family)
VEGSAPNAAGERIAPGVLRPGLLGGVRAVLATADDAPDREASIAVTTERRLAELGAVVGRCSLTPSPDPLGDEETQELAANALSTSGGAEVLVLDGPALYRRGDGEQALLACMQASWDVTRAVANEAMLEGAGGLVVAVAPPPSAGEHAEAARAGLENLARTLSIEWARFSTRAVCVAPGDVTGADEVAEVVGYLASPAGSYFSGCLLDLRGV